MVLLPANNQATEELLALLPPPAHTKPPEADQLELPQPLPPQEPTELMEPPQDQDQAPDLELDPEPEQVPPPPQLPLPLVLPLPLPPTEPETLEPHTEP
jgi:hypothetical protein